MLPACGGFAHRTLIRTASGAVSEMKSRLLRRRGAAFVRGSMWDAKYLDLVDALVKCSPGHPATG